MTMPIDIRVEHSDANYPPGEGKGRLNLNSTAVWVRVNGTWWRMPSMMSVHKTAGRLHDVVGLWLLVAGAQPWKGQSDDNAD